MYHSHWNQWRRKTLSHSFSLLKHSADHHMLPSPNLRLLLLSTTESRNGRTPASSGPLWTLREYAAWLWAPQGRLRLTVIYGILDWLQSHVYEPLQQNIESTNESLSSTDQLVIPHFTKDTLENLASMFKSSLSQWWVLETSAHK